MIIKYVKCMGPIKVKKKKNKNIQYMIETPRRQLQM